MRHRDLLGTERGFTLLELVVSLILLSIIVLIISGAMRLGLHSMDAGERKIDTLERLRASANIINSQVQSEVPLTWDDNGEKKFYFEGDSESMRFATNYSIWGGENGYAVVKYTVAHDPGGKYSLSASESPVGVEGSRATTLFNSLDAISFEYFYKDPTEEKGDWVDTWTDTATVPSKVKVHIVYHSKDFSLILPMRTPGTLEGSSATADSGSGGSSVVPSTTITNSGPTGSNPLQNFLRGGK